MPVQTCKQCRFYVDGYCHALPPKQQKQQRAHRPDDIEYRRYPQVKEDARACRYFQP